jgi:hypothetical protein
MPTAPRTPAEYHFDAAAGGLADLGKIKAALDEGQQTVEVLVAIAHGVLAIAAELGEARLARELAVPVPRLASAKSRR